MTESLKERALEELVKALRTKPDWTKVHAAEYLIWTGYLDEVKAVFMSELKLHHSEPGYRIGIWRVLAQQETSSFGRNEWVNNLFEAFADTNGADRLHALESLAKLSVSPLQKYPEATRNALVSENRIFHIYALWATAYAADYNRLANNRQELLELAISDSGENDRNISAFALRSLNGFVTGQWEILVAKALSERSGSRMRNSLLNTAFVVQPENGNTGLKLQVKQEMLEDYTSFSFEKRIDLALCLAEKGTAADLRVLQFFLDNENIPGICESGAAGAAEARIAAAFAILRIEQRAGSLCDSGFE